jgi:hypothetical protein
MLEGDGKPKNLEQNQKRLLDHIPSNPGGSPFPKVNFLYCGMFSNKHINRSRLMLPYFLNMIAAGEGSLPDY